MVLHSRAVSSETKNHEVCQEPFLGSGSKGVDDLCLCSHLESFKVNFCHLKLLMSRMRLRGVGLVCHETCTSDRISSSGKIDRLHRKMRQISLESELELE